MRKVEFRAKHEFSLEWVYGHYWTHDNDHFIRGISDGHTIDQPILKETIGQFWKWGEYEFYGGDLFIAMAAPSGGKDSRQMLCMAFDSEKGMEILVFHKKEWWHFGKLDMTNIERVGNIYDNPDLVK